MNVPDYHVKRKRYEKFIEQKSILNVNLIQCFFFHPKIVPFGQINKRLPYFFKVIFCVYGFVGIRAKSEGLNIKIVEEVSELIFGYFLFLMVVFECLGRFAGKLDLFDIKRSREIH